MHRFDVWRARRAPQAAGFTSQPEPRTIGHFARGRQLVAGNFLFSGTLVQAPGRSIWDIDSDSPIVQDELHGFVWLDDLAAVGDHKARARAQAWVFDWIARFGDGHGLGWSPELVGRRLIRWINHSLFILRGQDSAASARFFRSLGQQTHFLARRWKACAPGIDRIEAIAGIIYASLALQGMERFAGPAVRVLASDCHRMIGPSGDIASRNPEELLEILTLLLWSRDALGKAGRAVPVAVADAIARIVPTLRALRHADGGLARFHGGGRGLDGRLDYALASAGIKDLTHEGLRMGYARLMEGRTTVIADAAPPPEGAASANGHASTLAFELTSGRRPLLVNCGSGRSFGEEWRRAGRATPSHTTLGLEGYSSSRLSRTGISRRAGELLVDRPTDVRCEFTDQPAGRQVQLSHNGFQLTHGLTHVRTLLLSRDGRSLTGEDMLLTLSQDDTKRFDRAVDATQLRGVAFNIRFHLHPDVDARLDMNGNAVSMVLKSGEIWVFRYEGPVHLSLDVSVYLENGRLKPRSSQQVVLSARTIAYATRVRWSLTKAQDTPDVLRDLVQAELVDSDE